MNVSAACPQCGAIANSNDKFCNTCGTPLNQRQGPGMGGGGGGAPGGQAPQAAPPPAQPVYAQPPGPAYGAQQPYQQPGYPPQAQPPQYGAPGARPTRCQLGHDIMPGMSYCAQGHPIALDAMQFASDPNAYAPAQAPPPPPPPPPYGAAGGYGAPQQAPPPPPYDPGRPPAPAQGLGFGGPPQYQPPPLPPPAYGAPAYPAPAPQPVFQPAAVPPPPPPGQYAPPPALQAPPYAIDASPERLPTGAKQLRGFVVTFQTNPAGEFWPLYTGRLTVGRANAPEPADVALTDATISSRHAAFSVDVNAVLVEDTNSTNGTYVNEEHIGQNGRRELRDGDRVRFGGYTTLVKILGRP